mgnify:FL=1
MRLEQLKHSAEQRFDIRIAADGRWFHEGGVIRRMELIKLFASALTRDGNGDYWLVTPVEKGRITVDETPFIISNMQIENAGNPARAKIVFHTNLDDEVLLDLAHPLYLHSLGDAQDLRPYVDVRDGLAAKLSRPVYYELAGFAEQGPGDKLGVWSHQQFFMLEA